MPSFSYKGRTVDGKAVQGTLEAQDQRDAATQLRNRGITPLQIAAGKGGAAKAGAKGGQQGAGGLQGLASMDVGTLFQPPIKPTDLLLFTRQIATLLKAGVPIMRALSGLQESTQNPTMKSLLQDIREKLDSGRELSSAMSAHTKVFEPFYLNMIRVGELTGQLDEIFRRLFTHLEFEQFMREQVKSALRYPSFVILAMLIAIIILNAYVIPAFAKVFQGFGAELPTMTKILLASSSFTVNYWPYMLVPTILLIGAFKYWTSTKSGKYTWDFIKLKIPIAGKIILKASLSRFSRSFALALRSGVPLIQALNNVSQTMDNAYMVSRLEKMRETIERGETLIRAAAGATIFTPIVLQMIAVGEESGAIDDMLQEVAEIYQREVEYELKTLSQQIEPILITFLGAMVLVLALGIFLPMWDLGKAAKGK